MPYNHEHDNEVVIFAETDFRNKKQKFGIKTDDRRRHVYVLGKSGTGKTTLLENMILEDIYAGHGVGFVDPHGDSSEKLLDYIPSHRVNDIVYFNPADVDNPVGFNILETVDETHKHLVAGGLMSVFKKIWEDLWSARMEYILNNAILALLDYPGSTLLGINRLLSDKEYRNKVIASIKDPVVKAFWLKEFAGYQQKFAAEAVAPIQNKVGQFLSSSIIRNVVAQVKSTIDIRKIIDEGKIFIMNLAKGRIGEDTSRLLGGMLITKLQLSAMERVDIPEKDRLDFYLYVDEFQNFATGSFAEILSEARKYRLNLILAHQYIAQLDEKVQDGVFGNVGTHIVFRVGAADAAAFEEEFAPVFVPEDLVNLANHNIYLKLMIDGAASQPFSATTLPPIGTPTGSRDKVIAVSRERYASKRDVIEEKVERWWGFGEAEEKSEGYPNSDRTPYSSSRSYPESGRPPRSSATYQPTNLPTYPAICSRCGKNTTAKFNPDPNKPFYCEDCLPIMREKIRLQSESPRRPTSFRTPVIASPPLSLRGGVLADEAISRSPRVEDVPRDDRKKEGLSLSALVPRSSKSEVGLTPRPPKVDKRGNPPPLEKGDRGGFINPPQPSFSKGGSNSVRPSPPKIRE